MKIQWNVEEIVTVWAGFDIFVIQTSGVIYGLEILYPRSYLLFLLWSVTMWAERRAREWYNDKSIPGSDLYYPCPRETTKTTGFSLYFDLAYHDQR